MEKAYKLPMRVFELRGRNDESIKLRIEEVFGFPDETSINGGYDANCKLNINIGYISVSETAYPASTGTFYEFYKALKTCHEELYGTAKYEVPYIDGSELTLEIEYGDNSVTVRGKYRGPIPETTEFSFEFTTDQSYINSVLIDLKKIVNTFGTNKGI